MQSNARIRSKFQTKAAQRQKTNVMEMHWHIDIWFIHHMPEMKTIQWNLVFEKKAAPSIGIEESENRMKHAY